ncbi:MAG: hypothetical protein ACOC5T_00560 [Elusimicrobiota bacterium]
MEIDDIYCGQLVSNGEYGKGIIIKIYPDKYKADIRFGSCLGDKDKGLKKLLIADLKKENLIV